MAKAKKKDYYWITRKSNYVKRLDILNNPYKLAIWQYLQAYVIRGKGSGYIWDACHKIYKSYGILAASVSTTNIAKALHIGRRKVIQTLQELDQDNHIIKYSSKSTKKRYNTNIYIIGMINHIHDMEDNIYSEELYLVDRLAEITPYTRQQIVDIYNRQLQVQSDIDHIIMDLAIIQRDLFEAPQKQLILSCTKGGSARGDQ